MQQPNTLSSEIRRLLHPALIAACTLPGTALAGPVGGDVVRGSATIETPDPRTTQVSQQSDKAVVNWQEFSIAGNEYVIFNQPDASAVILNRVIGNNASEIFGTLEANGQVFLVNPNGIFFGPGATLDVHGLVASTLDIDDDDFMDGDYVFTRDADAPDGSVINAGEIRAADGGYVVLAGDYVENDGLVAAQLGHVALASGNRVTLDIEGDGLVSFAVDEATLAGLAGVRNAGEILADGSTVIMTAQVAGDLVASAVNNEGLVQARSVEEHKGAIVLRGAGGNVDNRGTLVADAAGDDVDGGIVRLLSDRDVRHTDGAVVSADGGSEATGGDIRLIAERDLFVEQGSSISAQGGAQGGFVEVSGHAGLQLHGDITIGNGGELLIDPETLEIVPGGAQNGGDPTDSQVGVDYIEGQLDGDTDVTLIATQLINADPGVTGITATGAGNLSLLIGMPDDNYGISCNDFGVCSGGLIGAVSGGFAGAIVLDHVDINIAGSFSADGDPVEGGTIALGNVSADNIGIGNGHVEGNTAEITAGDLTAGHSLSLRSTGNITTGDLIAGAWIEIGAGDVLQTGDITATESLNIFSNQLNGVPVPGPVQTGAIQVINATGHARADIRGQQDVQTGAITVHGTPDGSGEVDSHLILISDADLTVDGDLDVQTGTTDGLAKAELFAGAGTVHVTGNMTFITGEHPLFAGPAFLYDENGVFIDSHDLHLFGENVRVDGTTTNNFSLRVSAFSENPEAGTIEMGDIVGRRLLINGTGPASFGDMELTRSVSVRTEGDITTGNIDIVSPGPEDTPDLLEHTAAQIILESVSGSVTTADLHTDGWRNSVIRLWAIDITTGNITAVARPYHWDSEVGGPEWFVNSAALQIPWSNAGTSTTGTASVILGRFDSETGATMEADNVTIDGNLTVEGIGGALAGLHGNMVEVTGAVGINATGATIDTSGILTPEAQPFFEELPVEGTFELNAASIGLGRLVVRSGAGATFGGDIAVEGPSAVVDMQAAALQAQGLAATGTGEDVTVTVFDGNGDLVGAESRVAGQVTVLLRGAEGSSMTFDGDIALAGSGTVGLVLDADAIAAQSVSLDSGLGMAGSDGVFPLHFNDTTRGAWEYGLAEAWIGREGADIAFTGGIQAHGHGDSEVELTGADISVAGDIGITTGPANMDQVSTHTETGPDGNTWAVDRTTTGTENFADLHVDGTGAVTLGNVNLEGGDIQVEIGGASVQVGNLSATASGFSTVEVETWENLETGESFTVSETVDAAPVFVDIIGDTIQAGDVSVTGTGVAALLLEGTEVSTGGLSASAGDGSLIFEDSRDDTQATLDAPHAVIAILGTDNAQVGGNITLQSDGHAHLGAAGTVDGNVSVLAGLDIEPTANALIDLIKIADAIDDPLEPVEDDFPVLPAMNLQATGSFELNADRDILLASATIDSGDAVTANAGNNLALGDITAGELGLVADNGGIDLTGSSVTVSGDANLLAGTDIVISGAAFDAGALSMTASGDILNQEGAAISSDSLELAADGDISLAASTLSAVNAMTVNAGGNLALGDITAGALGLVADNGGIDLTGSSVTVSGDASLLAGTDIVISGATVDTGTLSMVGGGDIRNQEPAAIDAGALVFSAGGDILLGESSLVIGDATIADVGGDPDAIAVLADNGLATAGAVPNGTFVAQGALELGTLTLNGSYLYLQATEFSLAEFTPPEAGGHIVQATPFIDTTGIVLEGDAGDGETRIGYSDFLSRFGTASFVVGNSGHEGDITVGLPDAETEELDIGDSNLLLASTGTASGLGLVATTGLIGSLDGLARVAEPEEEFQTPTSGEITGTESTAEVDTDDPSPPTQRSEQDDEDEDDETGTVELADDPESDDTLSTHDTADEDLVCE